MGNIQQALQDYERASEIDSDYEFIVYDEEMADLLPPMNPTSTPMPISDVLPTASMYESTFTKPLVFTISPQRL